jgi:hypothetical protein
MLPNGAASNGQAQHQTIEPWDFQPGIDSPDSWAAFRTFLALPPPRKLIDVSTITRRAAGTVREWANHALWRDRALAWDRHCQQIIVDETEAAHRRTAQQVAERHAELTRLMLAVAETELVKLVGESQASASPVLNARDVARLVKESAHLDRLAANLPTEIQGSQLDFKDFTDTELAEFDRLMAKARGGV